MKHGERITRFLRDETGAVTVDYVVLSGALTGVGVTTAAAVSGGVNTLAQNIASELMGTSAQTQNILASDGFAGGDRAGWTGGTVMDIDQFGELLVMAAGETMTRTAEIPEGTEQVTFSFDVASGDTVDLETAFFYLNDELITHLNSQSRPTDSEETNLAFLGNDGGTPAGFSARYETIRINENIGGDPYWKDSITRVYLTMDNPPPEVTFAMTNNLNESIDNEFYGLDNFEVSY
ncbi:Flp family type IVb pilin [Roseobacter sp. HKCCA2468]|uniref:Flp family type IVb pilin n=1 Tax=Roseobacter sp. HKCCA2468 TaxID=3120342 RepID=UPI0030EDC51D